MSCVIACLSKAFCMRSLYIPTSEIAIQLKCTCEHDLSGYRPREQHHIAKAGIANKKQLTSLPRCMCATPSSPLGLATSECKKHLTSLPRGMCAQQHLPNTNVFTRTKPPHHNANIQQRYPSPPPTYKTLTRKHTYLQSRSVTKACPPHPHRTTKQTKTATHTNTQKKHNQ